MNKVLVVDDIKDNIMLLTFELEDDGFQVLSAYSGEECLKIVEEHTPDLILLDINMPGMSGIETLKHLKDNGQTTDIPVIMVSANNANKDIIEAIDLGAHDFVAKPIEYPVLAARMRSALRLARALFDLEKANFELNKYATTDSLTGCYNRRQFFSLTDSEISKAKRRDCKLSLIMLDIDHFKQINDQFGHAAGDKALVSMCELCKSVCRDSDILGRLGGEEFALCCPDADIDGAVKLAERIRIECENMKIEHNDKVFSLTISIGVTRVVRSDVTLHEPLQRADAFLYNAKHTGRNKTVSDLDHGIKMTQESSE
ncbi:Response regulator PleD [Thalassocella blandensis]|nr:Response regulator PleD [Thalassocella blandensis]